MISIAKIIALWILFVRLCIKPNNKITSEIKEDSKQAEITTYNINNQTTNEIKEDTKQIEISTNQIDNQTTNEIKKRY